MDSQEELSIILGDSDKVIPISPYLFLIVSDILSLNIRSNLESRSLKGIKLSRRGPQMLHLFFVDDSLFFYKAKKLNCRRLKEILDSLCLALGQAINYEKS